MPTSTTNLTTITMPQLGESVVEGTLGNWLKGVGDAIAKYDALVEVETDKANAELPAPVAGTLVEILVEPGTTVAVGTDLCRIEQGAAAATPEPAAALETGDRAHSANGGTPPHAATAADVRHKGEIADEMTLLRVRSSPVVRRTAEEHGVDLAEVAGSGISGRVTKRDLLAFIDGRTSTEEVAPPAVTTPTGRPEQGLDAAVAAPSSPPTVLPAPAADRTPAAVYPGDEVVPVTPMRRAIAERMVFSERTAPHATVVMEVDMTGAVALRAARREEFRRREGIDLTYLPFVLKAVTLALPEHPRLNAVWDEERIIHRRDINLGVAVALDDGLVVPVIKHADRLSLAGLVHAVAELAAKARARTLAPDELDRGTFTVNNPGTFGSLVSTPILVPPQTAILSMETIIKRPVVIDDMIAIRSMMNLSLSIDHRALDGLAATRFLQGVKRWLENVDDDLTR